MTTKTRLLALLTAASVAGPVAVRANDVSIGRRIGYGVAAVAMNVVPVVSVFASQRCLPGYIACKLSFAGMGLVASATQLVAGGDVEGSRRTAARAISGDWVVLPRHLEHGIKADPYPEAAPANSDPDLPPL